jgi:glycosyltransferase involved in cell wall biosynthesis
MRILFLVSRDDTNPRAAGGDVQGCVYARYLAEAGHDVTYLTSHYPGARRSEVIDGVRVLRPAPPALLPLAALRLYQRERGRFDVVYQEAIGGTRLPFLAPLYVGKPLVSAWYQANGRIFSNQYPQPLAGALSAAERLLAGLHGRSVVVTPSEARRCDLLRLGFDPKRVFVVPPIGIDGPPPGHRPAVVRQPLIVWLGKVRRYKRIDHAVQAMQRVITDCPEAKMVIAGRQDDSGYQSELCRLIRDLGLSGRVSFALNLSEEQKYGLLSAARALVLPSPIEGFGIVILEANVCGTPAVVSDGVPEDAVVDGYNGLRVPFGDIDALGAGLVRVLKDDTLFETISRNATQHAGTFSKARVRRQVEDLFRRAVAGANHHTESAR